MAHLRARRTEYIQVKTICWILFRRQWPRSLPGCATTSVVRRLMLRGMCPPTQSRPRTSMTRSCSREPSSCSMAASRKGSTNSKRWPISCSTNWVGERNRTGTTGSSGGPPAGLPPRAGSRPGGPVPVAGLRLDAEPPASGEASPSCLSELPWRDTGLLRWMLQKETASSFSSLVSSSSMRASACRPIFFPARSSAFGPLPLTEDLPLPSISNMDAWRMRFEATLPADFLCQCSGDCGRELPRLAQEEHT
mmetsp:Transcript_114382/g.334406  ORF Transcript_114382/g.334406 Transcript_114382/m.334406 type:complete len:250 (+) Transcript_114382:379-1128(+)